MEAADLGVRLCQYSARSVFSCYLIVLLPVTIFSLALIEIVDWLPALVLWWAKPWLDRTILFVLSRAAFGQKTSIRDLWEAQRQVWWGQIIRTWTTRRLSPWRSYTQPAYQLEGQRGSKLRKRIAQLRRGHTSSPLLMTSAFSLAELALTFALLSLIYWFAPQGYEPDLTGLLDGTGSTHLQFAYALAYAFVIAFLEPFYVASGFAMYLNRRVELEAWDIEQEFRRAFAQ